MVLKQLVEVLNTDNQEVKLFCQEDVLYDCVTLNDRNGDRIFVGKFSNIPEELLSKKVAMVTVELRELEDFYAEQACLYVVLQD